METSYYYLSQMLSRHEQLGPAVQQHGLLIQNFLCFLSNRLKEVNTSDSRISWAFLFFIFRFLLWGDLSNFLKEKSCKYWCNLIIETLCSTVLVWMQEMEWYPFWHFLSSIYLQKKGRNIDSFWQNEDELSILSIQ